MIRRSGKRGGEGRGEGGDGRGRGEGERESEEERERREGGRKKAGREEGGRREGGREMGKGGRWSTSQETVDQQLMSISNNYGNQCSEVYRQVTHTYLYQVANSLGICLPDSSTAIR